MICNKCELDKPETEYYRERRSKCGLRKVCKACITIQNATWRAANLEKWNAYSKQYELEHPEKARHRNIRKFGITPEGFDALLDSQDGVCAICKGTNNSGQALHIDHDHACCPTKSSSCGKCVRGLLCFRCNVGIGYLQDDPEILSAAIAYLS